MKKLKKIKIYKKKKKQRHHFTDKDLYSQSYGFSSNRYESWTIKKAEC